jgi:sec-independent protein translocase protein TatA
MGSVGGGELLLIFLAILLLFGAKRIPEIARGLGRGIREFKEATRDIQREFSLEDPPSTVQQPAPSARPMRVPRTVEPHSPVDPGPVPRSEVRTEPLAAVPASKVTDQPAL